VKYLVATIILLIAVIGGWVQFAQARSQRSAIDTQDLAQETCATKTLGLVQGTVTDVIAGVTALAGATSVELYNPDSSKTLNFGFTTSLSTQSNSANYGREVLPKTGVLLTLNLDKIVNIYAETQNTTAISSVTVTQCR